MPELPGAFALSFSFVVIAMIFITSASALYHLRGKARQQQRLQDAFSRARLQRQRASSDPYAFY